MSLIPPPNEATDIFSLSDQALSERYQFVEEIGFGNWGSVWLCRPKDANGQPIEEAVFQARGTLGNVAVKLVHRSKTPTTAARVRSLWNEMKIVRSFKNDPHPSIIPFYNFIITPSYALISMAYLPTLVPVEVPELRAKPWFLSLISAVAFLHARGVVHNDIKPANILLTATNPPVPVLVDFGFAEKYDSRSSKAFLSNLAYGTPEYLSPERARGLPHDTRKSDVWSLGVTIFEILRGRTPFEHVDPDGTTETFSSKAELEKYWGRTVKGKWVGKWAMSKGLERLLRKMILPNADLRITAPVALNDPYFDPEKPGTPSHQSRSSLSLRTPSEIEASRSHEITPSWGDRTFNPSSLSPPASLLKTVAAAAQRRPNVGGKENNPRAIVTVQGKENQHARRESQDLPRLKNGKGFIPPSKLPALVQPFKQGARKAPSFHGDTSSSIILSPSSTSTNVPRRAASGLITSTSTTRHNHGANPNASFATTDANRTSIITISSLASKENSVPSSRVGGKRIPARKPVPAAFAAAHKAKIVEPLTPETPVQRGGGETWKHGRVLADLTKAQSNVSHPSVQVTDVSIADSQATTRAPLSPVVEDSPRLVVNDGLLRNAKESPALAAIKQSLKQSLDKGVRFYKSSTLVNSSHLLRKQSSGGLSSIAPELRRNHDSVRTSQSQSAESVETDQARRNAKSSLPAVQNALRNEQAAAENRLDRMTIWIRNVEKVVEDARANFAAGSMTPLPPLPVRRASVGRRAPRVEEIFKEDDSKEPSPQSPPRQRRVTLVSASPETDRKDIGVATDGSSIRDIYADRQSKTHSVFDIGKPITPLDKLQLDLLPEAPRSPTRLSAVLDPNVFFNLKSEEDVVPETSFTSTERLRAVMTPVDPVFPNPLKESLDPTDYERILLASSGVKRNGKGFESNITTCNVANPSVSSLKQNPKLFHSVRRGAAPPPETPRKAVSVDELGALSAAQAALAHKDGNNTIKFMRRAFKVITGGGSVSRRLSKAA